MTVSHNTKIYMATVALSFLLVMAFLVGSVGTATARYRKDALLSVVYGEQPESTLSADGCVYDLGCWNINDAEDPQATIVLQQNGVLKGTLRFFFDDVTTQKRDVVVLADAGFSGVSGERTVNEADGQLELPFSLIVSTQSRSGVVSLDVEWVPADGTSETLTARYLLTLNPQLLCVSGANAPTFGENTGFLTKSLLRLSVNVPADGGGVMLAHGVNMSGAFAAGTRYYTAAYPAGVTLLKDSVLYFPFAGGSQQEVLVDCKDTTASTPVKITVGSSDVQFSTTTQTAAADSATLTVSGANGAIVSIKSPLALTIKEAAALADSRWNDGGQSGAQLSFELQRLVDGRFSRVASNADISLTVAHTGNSGTLTVSAPTGKQPAGTYRLVITQTYNGCVIYTNHVRFFIDYR